MYEHDNTDWRYDVTTHPHQTTPTLTRGRVYRLPSDWTTDAWIHYWDGLDVAAFTDDGYRNGLSVVTGTDTEWGDRAIAAYEAERNAETGSAGGLDRLAVRLTGSETARFIVVHLDRGTDMYVLSWDGDPDHSWRDEIEAVWHGDIWRCETEEYVPGFGPASNPDWVTCDDVCEEWYGEDKAVEAHEKMFPLAEFPAELFIPNTTD